MSKQISVVIADDNDTLSSLIKEYLEKNTGDISVKAIAKDGIEAFKMVKEISPDVIVLDLIMPNLDGIGVLESIAKYCREKKPVIIALSAIGNDVVVQKAMQLGADYYLMKPFDVEILASHIRQLYMEKLNSKKKKMPVLPIPDETESDGKDKESVEEIVTDLIIKMGITPNMSGYYYLREAVLLSIERPILLNGVSKFIYPILAANHKTTARNVDRAIKAAIDSIRRKSKDCDNKANPVFLLSSGGRLSNAQVIMLLAEKAIQRMSQNRNRE